jgi:hypothetical protein
VGGAQTAEVPALHAAGEALTDRGAGDVDELADDEMVGLQLRADFDQRVLGSTRNSASLRFGSTLATCELAALGLGFFTLTAPAPSWRAT